MFLNKSLKFEIFTTMPREMTLPTLIVKYALGREFKLLAFIFAFCLLLITPACFASGKKVVKTQAKSSTAATSYAPMPVVAHPVRIGLASRQGLSRIAVWAPGALFVDGKPVFPLKEQKIYTLANGKITELGTNSSYVLPSTSRSHLVARDGRIWCNNRWYRGCLELINFGSRITVINLLDLEEYLLGVVPSEMPASWHIEALKAQAVAARSYAWAHLGNKSKWVGSEGYELVPDVRDQAYKGLAAEAPSTFMAVHLTRGCILKDSGKVKPGFYRATVGDAFENLNIRKSTVSKGLIEKMSGVTDVVGITVKRWDSDGNAVSLQVMGAKTSREISGVHLAKMLGFSTAGVLDVQEQGNNWVFTYRGPGNGARGLSQHGAQMLAKNGWRFEQILQQYYQDNDGHLRLDSIDAYAYPANAAAAATISKTK